MEELAILTQISQQLGELVSENRATRQRLEKGDEIMKAHELRIRALEDAELARRVRAAVIGALAGGAVIIIEKAVEIYFAK